MAFARIAFKILLTLAIAFVAVGLFLPSTATVSRSIEINSPVRGVYPHVSDLRKFHAWSPWAAMDPNTRYSFEGPEAGVGARMIWQSTHTEVGVGSMQIVDTRIANFVRSELDFGGKGGGFAEFHLTQLPSGYTQVEWRFVTDFGWDLFGRYIGLMLDGMVGPSYETGLQTLKQRVEAGA